MSNSSPNKWQKLNYRRAQKIPKRSLVVFVCFVSLRISYCKCWKRKKKLVVEWGNRSIHIKKIIAEFISETREERETWRVIFKIFKGETNKKPYPIEITYPPQIFKNVEENGSIIWRIQTIKTNIKRRW